MFCTFFFKLLPKFSDFINSDDSIEIYRTIFSLYSKKYLNLIKKWTISSEKLEIQVIIYIFAGRSLSVEDLSAKLVWQQ